MCIGDVGAEQQTQEHVERKSPGPAQHGSSIIRSRSPFRGDYHVGGGIQQVDDERNREVVDVEVDHPVGVCSRGESGSHSRSIVGLGQ